MPEPVRITEEVKLLLAQHDLAGINILITSGPTCEDIDPVRFITNRSTGKMGAAIVEDACTRGAKLKVISGPVMVEYAPWATVINVRSAQEMLERVKENLSDADVLIMAAAVAAAPPIPTPRARSRRVRSQPISSLHQRRTSLQQYVR